MTILLRWAGYLAAALILIALLFAAWVWIASNRAIGASAEPKPVQLAAPSAAERADAPRMMRVLGCVGCHGEGLRGRLFFDMPGVAKLHAPNLALLAAKATDAQLEQGIRQGIGHDGRALLVMPSEGYQYLTDGEVAAIIATIRALPPAGEQQPPVELGPRGRLALALGKFRSAPKLVAQHRGERIPDFGPRFARGKHIVEVNCAECHGPRLQGNEVEPGVVAPNLDIAGAYDLPQFRTMLRTGVPPSGRDLGLMGEIARRDFKHFTDAEIADIHAYLAKRAQSSP